jgi:hypothetical protein
MKPVLLLFLILLLSIAAKPQNSNTHYVEPIGEYKKIDLANDTRIFAALLDTLNTGNTALADSVKSSASNYIPPVLYALSYRMFFEKKYNEAMFWYYTAQLRARYDVNRCTDKTANASQYNMLFGEQINPYAFAHLDSLEKIIPKVVEFVRNNAENYDQHWINLSGMDAMSASLDGKSKNKNLSVDKNEWAAIKTKTVDGFYSDFKEVVAEFKKKKKD